MARQDYCAFLGRLLLALTFLAAAFGKILHFDATAQTMLVYGIPSPYFLCALAILIEAAGGLSLALGFYSRWGAALLTVFLIPVTLIFHVTIDQRTHLIKNLAIMGGLLMVLAFGPGALSFDGERVLR